MKALLRSFMTLLLLLVCVTSQAAPKLPGDAAKLLPVLSTEITQYWPALEKREWVAGLIEQESLWKVNAHLRTSREHGCGLGQFTVAYNADGSVRFDALGETKRLDRSLANWNWQDCTNAQYQMRAIVLKLRSQHRDCAINMVDDRNAKACNAGKYNGGAGSVNKRIRTCRATVGCNPKVWEGHLALQCPQAKVKVHGYGESFCDINSKYPGRIELRMVKFQGLV